jgi:hypothetical protein
MVASPSLRVPTTMGNKQSVSRRRRPYDPEHKLASGIASVLTSEEIVRPKNPASYAPGSVRSDEGRHPRPALVWVIMRLATTQTAMANLHCVEDDEIK